VVSDWTINGGMDVCVTGKEGEKDDGMMDEFNIYSVFYCMNINAHLFS
jgi:hypothetical protein